MRSCAVRFWLSTEVRSPPITPKGDACVTPKGFAPSVLFDPPRRGCRITRSHSFSEEMGFPKESRFPKEPQCSLTNQSFPKDRPFGRQFRHSRKNDIPACHILPSEEDRRATVVHHPERLCSSILLVTLPQIRRLPSVRRPPCDPKTTVHHVHVTDQRVLTEKQVSQNTPAFQARPSITPSFE